MHKQIGSFLHRLGGFIDMETQSGNQEKPRILCLHGVRTSAKILKDMIITRWPQILLHNLDLHFLDAPFLADVDSGSQELPLSIHPPPHYEWYQTDKEHMNYTNLDVCIQYIEDYMIIHGPFDGLLGFSQGAFLSATVPALQSQGAAFTRVPKIKLLIIISGAKFKGVMKLGHQKHVANVFSSPIHCPSLHFIGENDFLKEEGTELLESFVDPVVIYHPKGHTVPKLDEKSLKIMLDFIAKIKDIPYGELKGSCNSSSAVNIKSSM